jgi:hypothetical protein
MAISIVVDLSLSLLEGDGNIVLAIVHRRKSLPVREHVLFP